MAGIIERTMRKVATKIKSLVVTGIRENMKDSGATTPESQADLGKNPNTGEGSLRIVTGRLLRSWNNARDVRAGSRGEGSAKIKLSKGGVTLEMESKTPYAAAHEKGFSGTVNVSSHERTITQIFGESIEPRTIDIRAHSRKMNIPARPYAEPALQEKSEEISNVFLDELLEEVSRA